MFFESTLKDVLDSHVIALLSTDRQFADCESMKLVYRTYPHYVDLFRFSGSFPVGLPLFKQNLKTLRPKYFVALPLMTSENPLNFDSGRLTSILNALGQEMRHERFRKTMTLGIVLLKNDDPEGLLKFRLKEFFLKSSINTRFYGA